MADTSAASDSAAAAEAAPAPAPAVAVAVAADDAAATTEGTTATAAAATTTATTESATAAPSDAAAADTAAPEQAATGAGGGAGAGAAAAAGGEEGDAGTTSVEDVDVDMTPEVDEEKLKSLFGEHALRLPLNANSAPKGDLAVQDLSTMDVAKLTPLTPEIISRQATINIGTIGHVAHGKSTVVKAISGVQTVRFKNELVRNITIKLGYANAKIYRSSEKPYEYRATNSAVIDEFPIADDEAGRTWQLVRHVSFVDCPGHDILMATMLNGAAVMDAALLLVAGNEPCPQAQTSEHLAAVEIMQLSNIIILQNKIDLVKPEDAIAQRQQIKDFVAGTVAGNAPILPISAQLQYNVDVLAKYIVTHVPVPRRNFTAPPRLIVIRSFDVNKPGEDACNLKGGVAGGSILEGVLRVGDEIEVRPGKAVKDSAGKVTQCVPIYSRIVSLFAEKNGLQIAVPGGLIGVGTKMDPTLTRADRLVGQVLGIRGKLPDVFSEIEVKFHLLRRLLGVKTTGGEKQAKVQRLSKGEILMVNIGSTSSGGRVLNVKNDQAKIVLNSPVCTSENEKIALSRRVDKHWRLIGWGKIRRGVKIAVAAPSEAGAPALATDDE